MFDIPPINTARGMASRRSRQSQGEYCFTRKSSLSLIVCPVIEFGNHKNVKSCNQIFADDTLRQLLTFSMFFYLSSFVLGIFAESWYGMVD